MDARLNFFTDPIAGKTLKHFMAVGQALKDSPLPAATQELVSLRVSQINGCAVCIDIHTKDAAAAGETPLRLNLVAAWREAAVFTAAERAALELAEEGTRVADGAGGVGDEVWARAAEHYDEEQLTALVLLVSFMNMANRLNVITRQPAGDYEPGQFHRAASAPDSAPGSAPVPAQA
ncbi:carboxymuconolactone decarboxylase family protein [Streptomyces hiroshimensis]|uniref:Alkyl hydroperoxide reductase AhpD n=1 Tax=Streptomyces hiroshimensis TaxID=66424 RepID=A0ABQ2Z856_9ACTN|nr:carboxymuconolactone decarboxylase family protein [Streptomyces hiroshimensis]GGY07735.1 alkyl hydroperoxide reductase AhpD [Streptomyces hiroshimensis]